MTQMTSFWSVFYITVGSQLNMSNLISIVYRHIIPFLLNNFLPRIDLRWRPSRIPTLPGADSPEANLSTRSTWRESPFLEASFQSQVTTLALFGSEVDNFNLQLLLNTNNPFQQKETNNNSDSAMVTFCQNNDSQSFATFLFRQIFTHKFWAKTRGFKNLQSLKDWVDLEGTQWSSSN